MEVTLLGTGSPVPTIERGGTSVVVEVDGEPLLVDCGPQTVRRMLESGIPLHAIETAFFTHHHVDHNADFFQFVITGWWMGRDRFTVYGPTGTEAYVEALRDLYEGDIEYRQWFGHDGAGIEDIEIVRTTSELSVATDAWSVTAHPVDHSIETYAYRFEDADTGESCVISGDTSPIDSLADFAAGADLLIQDAAIGPPRDGPIDTGVLPSGLAEPMTEAHEEKHRQNHCTPTDAGEIAAEAGVGTLVLTHQLPFRAYESMADEARSVFDGQVLVAEDLMTIDPTS